MKEILSNIVKNAPEKHLLPYIELKTSIQTSIRLLLKFCGGEADGLGVVRLLKETVVLVQIPVMRFAIGSQSLEEHNWPRSIWVGRWHYFHTSLLR